MADSGTERDALLALVGAVTLGPGLLGVARGDPLVEWLWALTAGTAIAVDLVADGLREVFAERGVDPTCADLQAVLVRVTVFSLTTAIGLYALLDVAGRLAGGNAVGDAIGRAGAVVPVPEVGAALPTAGFGLLDAGPLLVVGFLGLRGTLASVTVRWRGRRVIPAGRVSLARSSHRSRVEPEREGECKRERV